MQIKKHEVKSNKKHESTPTACEAISAQRIAPQTAHDKACTRKLTRDIAHARDRSRKRSLTQDIFHRKCAPTIKLNLQGRTKPTQGSESMCKIKGLLLLFWHARVTICQAGFASFCGTQYEYLRLPLLSAPLLKFHF